jgi:transketolase
MAFQLGPRRAVYVNIQDEPDGGADALSPAGLTAFEDLDRMYRSLCALLYNYVPTSGHPGGSISSGRFVSALFFETLDYDLAWPEREDADILSYAAGHKAMGLYAMSALRNEIARVGAPELLPADVRRQMRLEDLLGFRRNPVTRTPLFERFEAKALDGHPTPATPFVRLATGASGVGLASSLGLALGAADLYGIGAAPRVHIVEGEGGLTPGRVAEALAAAGTSRLSNAVLHIDWNQASIDSNRVCRDGESPGDYVQWDPAELAYLHDWNVIYVPDGLDFRQILGAQRRAAGLNNGQPTAIVYRTVKGWKYGIEGRASHGAGHKLCSGGFYEAVAPLMDGTQTALPTCEAGATRCNQGELPEVIEGCFWEALLCVRGALQRNASLIEQMTGRLREARWRLEVRARKPRPGAPQLQAVYDLAASEAEKIPTALELKPGTSTTLRGELGRVLNHYNRRSRGALFSAAADLLQSTSIAGTAAGFPEGTFDAASNPESRLLSLGGICEDAMCGILSGLSAFGRHIGVASSYGAFLAPLGHIAARLHAIGNQARASVTDEPYRPFFMVCAHAGLKTGEDGPTHADPQALQLLQDNFPRGTMLTLTPWEPQELWPLVSAALARRPAVIAPFVTRPSERVPDRQALRLAPASEAAQGLYALRRARGRGDGTVVLQESGVVYAFVEEALPLLEREGVDLNVYCVTSAEMFDLLPPEEQDRIFPLEHAREAMGITGFTLPTMWRWIVSPEGRAATLHPYRHGHYLGSGQAKAVLTEAGLDGKSQFEAILRHLGRHI